MLMLTSRLSRSSKSLPILMRRRDQLSDDDGGGLIKVDDGGEIETEGFPIEIGVFYLSLFTVVSF